MRRNHREICWLKAAEPCAPESPLGHEAALDKLAVAQIHGGAARKAVTLLARAMRTHQDWNAICAIRCRMGRLYHRFRVRAIILRRLPRKRTIDEQIA